MCVYIYILCICVCVCVYMCVLTVYFLALSTKRAKSNNFPVKISTPNTRYQILVSTC